MKQSLQQLLFQATSVQARVVYLGVLVASFLILGGFYVSRNILDGFSRIERDNLLSEVGWVMLSLEAEVMELGDFANDLGVMSECRDFLITRDPEFLAEELHAGVVELFQFDLAVFIDAEGRVVGGVRYDVGLADDDSLSPDDALKLSRQVAGIELKEGTAQAGYLALDEAVFLFACHAVYDPEMETFRELGRVVIGRRVSRDFEEFDGGLGPVYAWTSRREESSWTGEGIRLSRDEIYQDFPWDESFEFDEVEGVEEVWIEDVWDDDELVSFDVETTAFEASNFYRLSEPAVGPDGKKKTQVMCSFGGEYDDAEIVTRVLVPRTVSELANQKARLVTRTLWIGGLLSVAFTGFAVREIRRRMKAENALLQANDQLESANNQKDRLFSIIGHDLRAPLNGVIRLSELMARAPKSFESKDVARFATNINQTGKQLHGLLENLLNWARFQTGQLPYRPESLDLAAIIYQVGALYRPRAEEKRIELDLDVLAGMTVWADRDMLMTVIRNLVSNAIKFTSQNGVVGVAASELDANVRISVFDNGIGMSEAEQETLFSLSPKQVERRVPESESGTGFGLILCQEMLRRHGSTLEVYSESGVGSEFSFSLPVPKNSTKQ